MNQSKSEQMRANESKSEQMRANESVKSPQSESGGPVIDESRSNSTEIDGLVQPAAFHQYMTVREAAARFGVCQRVVYKALETGDLVGVYLPGVKRGAWRISAATVEFLCLKLDQEPEPDLSGMTVSDVASVCRVSDPIVLRWIDSGVLGARRVRKGLFAWTWRVDESAVQSFLDRHATTVGGSE